MGGRSIFMCGVGSLRCFHNDMAVALSSTATLKSGAYQRRR